MKTILSFSILSLSVLATSSLVSCSDNDDVNNDRPGNNKYHTTTIGFTDVPAYLIGGPTSYGANLYYGAQDQITTGYITQIYDDTYVQFPVNYGNTYDSDYNSVWGYSFFNGGVAVSNWHNMEDSSFDNQLSVYNVSSPSGGNFLVATGSSLVTDIPNSKLSDYDGCAKIYLTDAKGYSVKNPGSDTTVKGDDEEGFFESVYINNTTYTFFSMKDGNNYANALNEENEGWFKVQFIAFDDNEPNEKPCGYTEAYLANFKKGQADDYMGIIDTWTKVDLSTLPECSVLVINFAGSDMGEWGLNTPTYCALDKFEISVEKD